MIRLFLVDDHAVVRRGLRAMLTAEHNIVEVVGEAANGQELLTQLPDVPTDVVLMDLNMPVLDGLATTVELQKQYPHLRILILSMMTHERTVGQLLAAGAHGYVLKNADQAEIVTAIQAVAAGKRFLCSEISLAILDKVLNNADESVATTGKDASYLTSREREILQLVADGLTNQQIADTIFTSRRTVETHRQSLLEKTGVKNTPALVKYAMEQGWLQ
ncbi:MULTISPECIES: response regulator [Hymenobacter]|uniref:Response regulator transcription factor n=2 Tax=Hymenobacter TaxID=89966 RepID=A0ABS6WVY2_9BACT|nr:MULTISPECIES: response regulator transcription factor [Hymenobacter]MBO3270388.1 response regulator transcription factor [Hymenobacter defluvii]MBW3127765.1 response regulator transcription factor [Hymenobacter profundi]